MIKDYPEGERPRERCLSAGAEALSLRECLAILLGTGPRGKGCLGLATEILSYAGKFPGESEVEERAFFNALENSAAFQLKNIKGLGRAGHTRLLAAFELARRYANFRDAARRKLISHVVFDEELKRALAKISSSWRNRTSEWLGFVPLFKAGGMGELCIVEKGVRTHVNVDLPELFAKLLALRPNALILVHNHPSGDLTPSPSDYELTEEVRELGKRLGMEVMAHLIVAPTGDLLIDGTSSPLYRSRQIALPPK